MAIKYSRGRVLLVSQVSDKNGVNPKDRFIVLIRDYDEADPLVYGVAVTGTFDFPLPPTSVRLPYHRQGRCKTGLDQDCVADCTWIVVATPADIMKSSGFAPAIQLEAILQQVQSYLPPPAAEGETR